MTKPHAEIREALVTGIRNNPEKSRELKHAAEVLIGTIDAIARDGENDDNRDAFQENYARLVAAAGGQSSPEIMSVAEIAKAFGLGGTHQ